jgi:hypothetical protein
MKTKAMKTAIIKHLKAIAVMASIFGSIWLVGMIKDGAIYFIIIGFLVMFYMLIYKIVNDK